MRSTWDYAARLGEFLAWAERIDPVLLHGSAVFGWNTDKSYLLDLAAAGVPVVPTRLASSEAEVRELLLGDGSWVVKPTVGANGLGVTAVEGAAWIPDSAGPWVVQPLVESVRTEGETSVFVIGAAVVAQLSKSPAAGEFRVQEERGGRTRPVPVTDEARDLADQAYAATERLLGTSLSYARIDLLRHDGHLVVTEVEVTEPGPYLDVLPGIAEPFADVLARRLLP